MCFGLGSHRENAGDLGSLATVPYQLAVGTSPQQQAQRIDQDRFSGAGFTGQRSEASREVERQLLDDGEVADRQCGEHAPQAGARPQ